MGLTHGWEWQTSNCLEFQFIGDLRDDAHVAWSVKSNEANTLPCDSQYHDIKGNKYTKLITY